MSFRFGTNQPYWAEGEEVDNTKKHLGIATMFAGSSAVIGAGFIPTKNGNIFDTYYKISKVLGHSSPYGLLASLRISEIVSPFISENLRNKNQPIEWSSDFLTSKETKTWISNISGISESDLDALNFSQGTLRFERSTGWKGIVGQGELNLIDVSGNKHKISSNVMLTERTFSGGETFGPRTSVNQFAEAVGSIVNEDLELNKTFIRPKLPGLPTIAHRWLPTHSISGSIDSWNNILNRLSYPRSLLAFKAQRLNKATQTITENIPVLGEIFKPFLSSDGIIKSGSSLKSAYRYLGFTAKIGAAGLLISQYDWLKRYKGDNFLLKEGLNTFSSGIIGAGAWYLANKTKLGNIAPYIGAFTAIGSFIGQNILPGFDKGIYSGISNTLTTGNIIRSEFGEVSGMSAYRRKLEDLFPGSTSFASSAIVGFASYGLFSLRHLSENRYYKFYKNISHQANISGKSKLETFFNLNENFKAWEKISFNLKPGHDLDNFTQLYAQGKWKRSIIPGEALNTRFIKRMEYLSGTGAIVFEKFEEVTKHLQKSSYAKWHGISGGTLAFGLGFLSHVFWTGKLFGSIETPEQLRRQATGEELIPVRKSRWWGAGGTPFEGGKISYYKPSLNALITNDIKNTSLWGEDVNKISPIERFIRKNFTYYLEEKHFSDRPYPISSPGFSDVPFIGKFLGATIGSIIKPPKLMHVNEWYNEKNGEYLNIPLDLESNPSRSIGGLDMSKPISPYNPLEVYADLSYKSREAAGFLGFLQNQIQSKFTGEENYSTGHPILAESSAMYDPRNDFWNLELGGFASLSEIPRRFFPKERNAARTRYNPIYNNLPSWIPESLRRGDQYSLLANGYARLPGAGYESLHPELKGVNPEDYPLWYKYDILANTASYSNEFRNVKIKLYGMRKRGELTPEIEGMIDRIDKQLESQKLKRNYYIESLEQKEQSYPERFLRNTYFNTLNIIKRLASPIEYLTFGGIRPTQKFLPVGNVVNDYKDYAIYGSETSFWDFSRAMQDYLSPAFYNSLRLFGYSGVPSGLQHKREISEYFDRLKYFKYMKLAEQAQNEGNYEEARQLNSEAHKTVYGINPFSAPLSIYSVLPQTEKDRFEGFMKLYKDSDRKEVLNLLPEDQKVLFTTLWNKQDGVKIPKSLRSQYSDKNKMSELENYFGDSLPREDWIGWKKEVDINDVKLKYIQSQGYNNFDFGMWPNQVNLLDKKPYLNDIENDININTYSSGKLSKKLLNKLNISNTTYFNPMKNAFSDNSSVIYINDDQQQNIQKEYNRWNES